MPTNQANQTQTATIPYETGPYVYRLTNAPETYDYDGTRRYGADYGDGMRLVAIPNDSVSYNTQVGRYASGMYRCETPRMDFPIFIRRYTTLTWAGKFEHTDVTELDNKTITTVFGMDSSSKDYVSVQLSWAWVEQD